MKCPSCGLEFTPAPGKIPAPAPKPAAVRVSEHAVEFERMEFGGYDWLVLEVKDGRALLLSEKVLEERKYHSEWTDITWEKCDLRAYLNGEFYNRFNESDRARIAETRVVNDDNQWYGTPGGDDTNDLIFLLSLEEVVKLFGDSGQLSNKTKGEFHISDQYNSMRIAYDINGKDSVWWLRSPGRNNSYAVGVCNCYANHTNFNHDGSVYVEGNGVGYAPCGVRPALWISLQSRRAAGKRCGRGKPRLYVYCASPGPRPSTRA